MRTSPTGQRPRKLKLAARRSASTTDPNGFFQHPEVNVVYSPECADIPADPALVCDTFVTIGLECAPALPGLDGTSIDLDFDVNEFQLNGHVLGGWYNSLPTNGQGTPDANGKVLIAQFSVKQNKDVTGTLTIFAKLSGSDDVTEYPLQAFDCFCGAGGGGGAPSGGGQGGSAPLGGGTTWFVDDGCNPPTDGSQADPFCTIQEGIAASALDSGDIVEVAPGTYTESIDFLDRKITVRSSGGQAVTTIDATGLMKRVVTCDDGQGLETVLDGFTITGGEVTDDPDGGAGMLIKNSSPTIIDCTFTDNHTLDAVSPGAGMYLSNSDAEVTNCTFSDNHSGGGAGGMCNNFGSNPTVTNCTFTGNTAAADAGGMGNRNMSNPTVTDCTFTGNSATSDGGAMYNNDSVPTVINCRFINNTAGIDGGALVNHGPNDPMRHAEITNCEFIANHAAPSLGRGGGMYNAQSFPQVEC